MPREVIILCGTSCEISKLSGSACGINLAGTDVAHATASEPIESSLCTHPIFYVASVQQIHACTGSTYAGLSTRQFMQVGGPRLSKANQCVTSEVMLTKSSRWCIVGKYLSRESLGNSIFPLSKKHHIYIYVYIYVYMDLFIVAKFPLFS
jgi:hypothetical protein